MKARLCKRCGCDAWPALYMGAPGWVCSAPECNAAGGPAVWLTRIIGFWLPGIVAFPRRRISYSEAVLAWWQAMGARR